MSLKRVAKLSLPVQTLELGDVYRVGYLTRQYAAVGDSILCTDEMTILLSCSGMIYDHDMPF